MNLTDKTPQQLGVMMDQVKKTLELPFLSHEQRDGLENAFVKIAEALRIANRQTALPASVDNTDSMEDWL